MIVDSHCHAFGMWPDICHIRKHGGLFAAAFELDAAGVDRALILAGGRKVGQQRLCQRSDRIGVERFYLFPDIDCYWSTTYHVPGAAERCAAPFSSFIREASPTISVMTMTGPGSSRQKRGEFFEVAEEMRQIVSIHVRPPQLQPLRQLARSFSSTRFLIHHLGFPLYQGTTPTLVVRELLECAEIENLHLKISGFDIGSARPWDYPYNEVIEIATSLIEAFGGARAHWGSNFPMCTPSMTYRQSLEGIREHVRWKSDRERDQVLGDSLFALLTMGTTYREGDRIFHVH